MLPHSGNRLIGTRQRESWCTPSAGSLAFSFGQTTAFECVELGATGQERGARSHRNFRLSFQFALASTRHLTASQPTKFATSTQQRAQDFRVGRARHKDLSHYPKLKLVSSSTGPSWRTLTTSGGLVVLAQFGQQNAIRDLILPLNRRFRAFVFLLAFPFQWRLQQRVALQRSCASLPVRQFDDKSRGFVVVATAQSHLLYSRLLLHFQVKLGNVVCRAREPIAPPTRRLAAKHRV